MKRSLLYLIILLSSCNFKSDENSQTKFLGKWVWQQGLPNYNFSLTISEISDSKLQGGYCGYPSDLSRIDCGNETDNYCKISGRIEESGKVLVNFTSCYSGQTGKAIITHIAKDSIKWETTESSTTDSQSWNGVVKEAILVRKKTE